jgi:lysophospholipase L1-like esterase
MKFLSLFSLTLASYVASSVRIMPFGDSITEWQCNNESQGGWRNYVAASLTNTNGLAWDFVGPRYGCGNHAGFSGRTALDLSQMAVQILSDHLPDIILLQIGTNDLFYNQPGYINPGPGANVTGTYQRISDLLSLIFTTSPEAVVLLSGVPFVNQTRCANYSSAPWHPPNCPTYMNDNISSLNAMLPTLVNEFAVSYSISFHDVNVDSGGFVEADYWTWGIHFTESGFQKIASSWWRHLKPIVSAMIEKDKENVLAKAALYNSLQAEADSYGKFVDF